MATTTASSSTSSTTRTSELVKHVRCFQGLDDATLEMVGQVLEPMEFDAGTQLCAEGEVGKNMFLIEAGEVAVLKQTNTSTSAASAANSNGIVAKRTSNSSTTATTANTTKEVDDDDDDDDDDGSAVVVEIARLGPGDIAGEMGLFGQKKRSATLLVADTSPVCKVWALDYDRFEKLLHESGPLARGLLGHLTGHLIRQSSLVAKLLAKDTEPGFHVSFFHATPFRNRLYEERNKHNYQLHFFSDRLTKLTVSLAAGSRVVVVSANDDLDADVVEELAALGVQMIALRCAGYNNVDLNACERFGISVANVPAYSPEAIAEHAVALILTLNRRIHIATNRVRQGNYSLSGLVGFNLHGRTVGVVGTGRIGAALLRILHGFGCRLLAQDLYPNDSLVKDLGVKYVELEELYAQSDIISLHAPLLPSTFHLIDKASIDKMKTGVMLINTARGALVHTEALLDGIKSGKIGFAGLDVYEEESAYFFEDFSEKVIVDDLLARLSTFNNVIVTGHQGSLTLDAQTAMVDITLGNIREFEEGKRSKDLSNFVGIRN